MYFAPPNFETWLQAWFELTLKLSKWPNFTVRNAPNFVSEIWLNISDRVRNTQRGPHGISEKSGSEATVSFVSTNIHPWVQYRYPARPNFLRCCVVPCQEQSYPQFVTAGTRGTKSPIVFSEPVAVLSTTKTQRGADLIKLTFVCRSLSPTTSSSVAVYTKEMCGSVSQCLTSALKQGGVWLYCNLKNDWRAAVDETYISAGRSNSPSSKLPAVVD